jgi:hypothetical protein
VAGFPVSDVIEDGLIHSIDAHKPNGIPIEFSHNAEGVSIRKEPQTIHKAPSQITLEGAEPQSRIWPDVTTPAPQAERVVYPGAGSEPSHGKKSV